MVALYDTMPDREFSDAEALLVDRTVQEWLAALGEDENSWHTPENLEALRHRVMGTADARWCAIYQWDPENKQIRVLREQGFALWLDKPGRVLRLDARHALEARVLKNRRPTAFPTQDGDEDIEQRNLVDTCGEACLLAPLNMHGEPKGLVKLMDSTPNRRFDQDETSLCQGIANLMGNALENAELFRAAERRALALEEAYRELQEADRLKDELIQNISHELRTPLAFISGYLDLLVNEDFGALNDEQKESMEVVIRKTQDLSNLVDDIMSIQTLEGDHLNRSVVQISHLAEVAMRAASVTASQVGLQLVRDFSDDLPLVYVDPKRINEVIDNLLSNAIKFSPAGGRSRFPSATQAARIWLSASRMTALESRPNTRSASGRASTRSMAAPRAASAAPAWVWRLSRASSRRTAARSGSRASRTAAARSISACPRIAARKRPSTRRSSTPGRPRHVSL
ncbi:MAG: GAF domain-containing protein [Anaerolineae bacterium]|nr:GAF domain-containing protein [Anaerolineae bacterium]